MRHPFEVLMPEYAQLLSAMAVRPEKVAAVDATARKILAVKSRFEPVTAQNGVPVVFIGPSFQREASLNFALNPAQGAALNRVSPIIPHNGPFRTWLAAALEAYRLNGLDRVGAGNWTWELICFYGELFNGLGYRDYHGMHSPYLWGGTNIQTVGKYTSDGHFDAEHMDEQLGIIPVAKRMAEIDASVAIGVVIGTAIPKPVPSGVAAPDTGVDVRWIQQLINRLDYRPALLEDGNYGRKTMAAVLHFQKNYGLTVDGIAGPETIKALHDAAAAIDEVASA